LLDLVAGGEHAPIDNVLHLINALQQELAATANGGSGVPATLQGSGDPVQLLLAEAGRQPAPVSYWLSQITKDGNAALGNVLQAAASAAFSGSDGPEALCHSVVVRHYPFDPASRQDAPIDDFIRLFAPGGMLDSYYQAQIKPYVDTRGTNWRTHALGGVSAPFDSATLASFQRAAAIRDIYFPLGGRQAQVRFTLTAVRSGGAKATLTLGSKSIATDATRPVTFTWPGADGMSNVSLVFAASQGSSQSQGGLQETGPWALFRLLAEGRIQPGSSPDTYSLTLTNGGNTASFSLQPGSSHNPFGRNVLAGFKCPVIR
jgi:type VI secretion system protein ImpL